MRKDSYSPPSTGLPELDEILNRLRLGDNVVWQLDAIEHYRPFTEALAAHAHRTGERLVYFRFADHPPVLADNSPAVMVHSTRPEAGFENFITQIHRTIREMGHGGYYVFDSLSGLSSTCYSDRMIGNFFKLTCPLLSRLNTIAYFALYRHTHSYHAALPIVETTQILIDVYRYKQRQFVQPSKIQDREDPKRLTLHEWDSGQMKPVTYSPLVSAVMATSPWAGLRTAPYRMVGLWDKTFLEAEAVQNAVDAGDVLVLHAQEQFEKLVKLIVPREKQLLELARRYLSLRDIIAIWKRMTGTGMVGGKAMGILLSRAILKQSNPIWQERLELHDTFYIGSDVFYTFLVTNDCWWDRQRQKDPQSFLIGNNRVRERILRGSFPTYITERFEDVLEYFGESPIIVRSSSLLEDNFGNAFSGKYDSVFCPNQGPLSERLAAFLDAVRTIYASTMSDEALDYRNRRGVLDKDEQMALVVQRVSGDLHGRYFFPHAAGVAYSYNPYVWDPSIDPDAGVVRLVFGLGTRAVDRSDDDYTRIIALNAPQKRPDSDFETMKRHTQRRVDVLDLTANEFRSVHVLDLAEAAERAGLPVSMFATRDHQGERRAREMGLHDTTQWIITFDRFLEESSFVEDMQLLLRTLREAYNAHVDIEFTVNVDPDGSYNLNLVQCRRFPIQNTTALAPAPVPAVDQSKVIIQSNGSVLGCGRVTTVDRIIYVDPDGYQTLSENERYALAEVIGRLTHSVPPSEHRAQPTIMLIGPGRWGTSTPSLGVPVSFAEINTVSVIWEIDYLRAGLTADLSLGTHFFNDMVEVDMLYVAHAVNQDDNTLRREFFDRQRSVLTKTAPDLAQWEEVVRVFDFPAPSGAETALYVYADSERQIAQLYYSGDYTKP